LIKYFDYWKARWSIESLLDVSNAEEDHEQEAKRHNAIDDDGENHNSWYGDCGVADFLAHMDCAIEAWAELAQRMERPRKVRIPTKHHVTVNRPIHQVMPGLVQPDWSSINLVKTNSGELFGARTINGTSSATKNTT
jgi:hypothetical protein